MIPQFACVLNTKKRKVVELQEHVEKLDLENIELRHQLNSGQDDELTDEEELVGSSRRSPDRYSPALQAEVEVQESHQGDEAEDQGRSRGSGGDLGGGASGISAKGTAAAPSYCGAAEKLESKAFDGTQLAQQPWQQFHVAAPQRAGTRAASEVLVLPSMSTSEYKFAEPSSRSKDINGAPAVSQDAYAAGTIDMKDEDLPDCLLRTDLDKTTQLLPDNGFEEAAPVVTANVPAASMPGTAGKASELHQQGVPKAKARRTRRPE